MSPGSRRLEPRALALAGLCFLLSPGSSAFAGPPPAPPPAPSPQYTLPVHAVVVTDGTYTPAITAAQIQQWVDYANTVYDDAGVQFHFDSANPDLSNLTNANLSHVSGDGDSFWAQVLTDGNAEAAKNPGKVTVFFRYGPIDPDPAKVGPTGGGFSDDSYNFIVMPGFQASTVCGNQNIGLFAHEAGHYLGLAHTFAVDFNTQAEAKSYFDNNGKKSSLFDGDGLVGTPPDPFSREWNVQCNAATTSVTISGVNFTLPRTNVMSYYDNVTDLAQDQIDVVRQTIEGNVHNLFPSDPAIQPAQATPGSGGSTTYQSPDIWIDSSFNGYGVYPAWQAVDSEGVPQGLGDPFWQGKPNYIRYRVRNLGPAVAATIQVQISVRQPASVRTVCGGQSAGPETILATQTIDLLPAGQSYQGEVSWVPPTSASAVVQVRILDTPFELSKANNFSQETLGTAYFPPGSLSVGALQSQTLILAVSNPCDLFKPIQVVPVGPPHDWQVTLDPANFLLAPGETRIVKAKLTPPQDATPGELVGFHLGVFSRSGDFSEPQGEFNLVGQVAQPMSWACEAPTSASLGTPLSVRGRAAPASRGLPVWLEYILPDGSTETHSATTDGQGAFVDTLTPAQEGAWTVQIFSEGDLQHQPGRSRRCGFLVGSAVSPQPSASGFQHRLSATEIFYRGVGCGPQEVEIRASYQGGQPASIVAFYRLRGDDGALPWNEGVAMTPVGDGWFLLTLSSDSIPGAYDFTRSQLEIQFVATDSAGAVLERSPVFSDVAVSRCSR